VIPVSFKDAIIEMMEQIAKEIPDSHKKVPVKAYLTGGGAVHYYCNSRVSDDIDLIMQFSVNIPENLFVVWMNEEGMLEQVHYDHTYNSTFGLLHEDYEDRAVHMITIDDKFEIYLLSPEDLIISKLIRFAQNDEEDIRNIIATGRVDKDLLYVLATDAIDVGVGFQRKFVKINLEEVMEMF
jgi:hypothetical protein